MTGTKSSNSCVDIVIVNYNGGAFISDCIQSLAHQSLQNYTVFIVDNASTDGSADQIDVSDPRISLIRNSENIGFAAACNQAARMGQSRWIAMLNPDTRPEPDWLEKTVAYGESTGAAMIGCKQVSLSDPSKLDGVGDAYSPFGLAWRGGYDWPVDTAVESGEIFGPCAAAALYLRHVFDEVGGFDESFFCYMEDVDFAFRTRLAGHFGACCAEAVVHHYGSGISGRRSPFTIYHGTRNRIWVWIKNAPPLMFWILGPLQIVVNSAFLFRSLFHGRFATTAKAIRDGFLKSAQAFRSRRDIQKNRKTTSFQILSAMTLSPSKLLGRAPDIRPIKQTGPKPSGESATHPR